ncbi:TPA: DUF1270 family protein, partial [Staphylococcus aureus]|nr:DUF1270 family protein [Staphylococcus aureus]
FASIATFMYYKECFFKE